MKKRLILLTLVMALFLTGCNATSYSAPVTPLPWSIPPDTNAEVCIYTLKRTDADGKVVTATGTVVYTLKKKLTAADTAYADYVSDAETRCLLTSEMRLTYTDKAEVAVRGKTDITKTAAVFEAASMTMVYAEREFIADRGTAADGNEVRNDSFTLKTDYAARTSVYTAKEWVKDDVTDKYVNRDLPAQTMDFSKAKKSAVEGLTDNEILYYYLRAMDIKLRKTTTGCTGGVESGGTGTIKLGSFLDMQLNNKKFKSYTMSYACASDQDENGLMAVEVNERLNGKFGVADSKIQGVKTSLSLSSGASGSGPSSTLYFATEPFTVGAKEDANSKLSEKVLLLVETSSYEAFTEYGSYVFAGTLVSKIEMRLSDYSFGPATDAAAFIDAYYAEM